MLRIFLKKVLGGSKSQIFFIGAKMRGDETEWQEAW